MSATYCIYYSPPVCGNMCQQFVSISSSAVSVPNDDDVRILIVSGMSSISFAVFPQSIIIICIIYSTIGSALWYLWTILFMESGYFTRFQLLTRLRFKLRRQKFIIQILVQLDIRADLPQSLIWMIYPAIWISGIVVNSESSIWMKLPPSIM